MNMVSEAGGWLRSLVSCIVLAVLMLSDLRAYSSELSDPAKANTNLATLTNVLQVRDLTPVEAAKGHPVRVRGVVTYWDLGQYKQFVQDNSAGIYVELNHLQSDTVPEPGERIEVSGFSGPGDYAPIIHAEQLRILGQDQYPRANVATIQMLMSGSEDSQWVALKGIVRDEVLGTNAITLTLSTGESALEVTLPRSAKGETMERLVDTAVRIQGVCSTIFDERRRLTGVELHVPDWKLITVLEPGPDDPFRLPVVSVSQLFQFHAGTSGLHRAHLRGNLVLSQADGSFFLQDASGGILVQTRRQTAVPPLGTAVEAAGFPAVNDRTPMLQEALVKSLSTNLVVVPGRLLPEAALNPDLNATVVSLEGRLIDQSQRSSEQLLTIQFGRQVVDASLERRSKSEQLPRFVVGSIVRLTGVYSATLGQSRSIESFRLLLRSPADVVLLQRPSWWTAQRTVRVLAVLSSVLLGSLGWVGLLRKRVQVRTRELRAEIEERKRAEQELKKTQGELLLSSRMAGMAEVATSVLHNVGNVLNSVNVSASLVSDSLERSRIANVARLAELLNQHANDLTGFLTSDPKGKQLGPYFNQLAAHLAQERANLMQELQHLKTNVEHIKVIVATQQTYARVCAVAEIVKPVELVEDALRMNAGALTRHDVHLIRQYDSQALEINVDKQKVLQILVNLVQNAKYACEESGRPDKCLTVGVANGNQLIKISVSDNGIGIPPENLSRIFNHGFTTRKHGHGFGLHSGAIAAQELGGALRVQSDGQGKGATFTLELPLKNN